MSEVTSTTPAGTPESPPPGYEHFPNPEGGEVGAGGSPDLSVETGGESPGLATVAPEQQALTPPPGAEQVMTPEQQAAATTQQQPIPAKEDETRFEYWHSKAGQSQRELDEIKGSQLHAIARHIQQTPELLDVVDESLRGGPITRPKGIPERPIRPQRPENYESSEAHDPETVSGRYRASLDDYLEKKDIYNDARDEQAAIQAKRDVEEAKLAEIRSGLIREGRLNEIEANEAMQTLFSSESMNPVTLANLYRLMKSPSQDQKTNQEKANQLLAKQKGLESPPPLATAGGETPPQRTPEQNMADSMRAHTKIGLKGNLR